MRPYYTYYKLFILLSFCYIFTYAEIKIVSVGDFMPGSTYPKPVLIPQEKLEQVCENIKSFMPDADIKIFNLEGVITKSTEPFVRGEKKYYFAIPPEYVSIIKKIGFNVASIVNNHILDFGWTEYQNTIKCLELEQISYAAEKGKVAEVVVGDKKVCVVAFGFCWPEKFYSILNIKEAENIVSELKKIMM